MLKITGIRFKRAGKVYYFDPGDLEMNVGQKAIVETVRGVEMGDVVISSKMVEEGSVVQPLKRIIRIATPEDIKHTEDNAAREPKALEICHEKVRMHKLPMKLVGAEYTFDNSKVIFYFTAEGRVDFRELVKDLASVFKMRIELRQIGVRDEAKLVGGLGPCGLPMCCTTWLGDFNPVSIKMAKEQNLSLNPAKISGICGRLMCCLKYESGMYDEVSSAESAETESGYAMRGSRKPACGPEKCKVCGKEGMDVATILSEDEGALDELGLPDLVAGPIVAEADSISVATYEDKVDEVKGRTERSVEKVPAGIQAAPSKKESEVQAKQSPVPPARGDFSRKGSDQGPKPHREFRDDNRNRGPKQGAIEKVSAPARDRRPQAPEFQAREKSQQPASDLRRPLSEDGVARSQSPSVAEESSAGTTHSAERPQGFNKNRRRRHGHRKPGSAPESAGPPKGE